MSKVCLIKTFFLLHAVFNIIMYVIKYTTAILKLNTSHHKSCRGFHGEGELLDTYM